MRLLKSVIPVTDQEAITTMPEPQMHLLHLRLGMWIRNTLGLWGSNVYCFGQQEAHQPTMARTRSSWRAGATFVTSV